MAFLRINGVTVPVADSSPRRQIVKVGDRSRSFRGQLRDARRFLRRSWDVRAIVTDHDQAHALEGLVAGRAQFFDLADGLQAATGLMPLPPGQIAGAVLEPNDDGAFGFGRFSIPAATTGTVIAWDAQLDREWTVFFYRLDGSMWLGHAQRSDGSSYVLGGPSSTFGFPSTAGGDGLFVRVTDGVVEIVKDGTDEEKIDDVAILSYRASDEMLEELTADPDVDGVQFGPAPFIRASGDMVGGEEILCRGTVTGTEIIAKPSRVPLVGWVNNARVVSFLLEEIDPRFFSETA